MDDITRVVRFIGQDGKEYWGEEPKAGASPGQAATVLSGGLYDGSLKRTSQTQIIKKLLAPVQPPNIFCIGVNYMSHYNEAMKKAGMPVPKLPVLFMKPTTSIVHPTDDVWIPQLKHGEELDWEVELAMVISKPCRNVKAKDALDYVLGYTVSNDVSSRFWQKAAGAYQWIKGKGFDAFCPMGPVLVLSKAIQDPQALRVICRVNGKTEQDSSTSDMIFTCAQQIAWLSNNMTLLPGTVILTGTPAGVAAGHKVPRWLKEGDVVECEVPGIGKITNKVVKPPKNALVHSSRL